MNNINEEYVEEYIRSILPERPDFLLKMERYAHENHVPIIHPEVAQFLMVVLKMNRPLKILELGTAIGYSAMVMAYSTDDNTEIFTIEKREDMIQLATKNISNSIYKDRIDRKSVV